MTRTVDNDVRAWPIGCIKPGGCERRRACGYANCPHQFRDISGEIDAAVAQKIAAQTASASAARTVDDVIADWTVRQSGRTHYEGQEPRDDELILAEITRLRAEREQMAAAIEFAIEQGPEGLQWLAAWNDGDADAIADVQIRLEAEEAAHD